VVRSYNEITPINVRMPIGHYAIAKHAGTIKFSSDFVISNVLYAPKFSLSLILVSMLCIASDDKLEKLYY
jgi:hypothetical protein